MSAIGPVGAGLPPIVSPLSAEGTVPRPDARAQGAVFGDVLQGVIESASESGRRAEAVGAAFAAGNLDDIHGAMIAVKEADISLRVAANVRNKLVDAFYELWRMNL